MIILGIILLLIGWLANIGILTTIGIILVVIGAVLFLLGATGRAVGGRKHWDCSSPVRARSSPDTRSPRVPTRGLRVPAPAGGGVPARRKVVMYLRLRAAAGPSPERRPSPQRPIRGSPDRP